MTIIIGADHENDESMCHAFAEYFEERVHKIFDVTRARVATEYVVMPQLPAAPPVSHALNDLCPTDKEELQTIIQSRPTKCCSLDVLPTWLLKTTLPVTLPTLVSIVNASLKTGVFS